MCKTKQLMHFSPHWILNWPTDRYSRYRYLRCLFAISSNDCKTSTRFSEVVFLYNYFYFTVLNLTLRISTRLKGEISRHSQREKLISWGGKNQFKIFSKHFVLCKSMSKKKEGEYLNHTYPWESIFHSCQERQSRVADPAHFQPDRYGSGSGSYLKSPRIISNICFSLSHINQISSDIFRWPFLHEKMEKFTWKCVKKLHFLTFCPCF